MSNELINQIGYQPSHVKSPDVRFAGGKYYLASLRGFGLPFLVGVEKHRRASEAEAEAALWKERLVGEYMAALLAMVGDGTKTESAEVVEPTA